MAKDIDMNNDISSDSGVDVNSCINSDFGGDIASDDGVDLNKSEEHSETMGKNKLGSRIFTGIAAGVTAVAGAATLGFQRDNRNEYSAEVPSEYHAVLDSEIKTPQDILREMAENFHDGMKGWADQKESQRNRELEQEAANASNRAFEESGAKDVEQPSDEDSKQETT